jgi:lantibiotic modifying enzyme
MCNAHPHSLTRRDAIKASLASVAALAVLPPGFRPLTFRDEANYLDAAKRARAWLAATAHRGPNGLTWAADPLNPKSESFDLYNGMPGVVLFLLEYAHATGDKNALADAAQAADTIVGVLAQPNEAVEKQGTGLYVGLAGLAYVLYETYRSTNETKYRAAAVSAMEHVKHLAKPVNDGVEWGATVDIISGNAGTGLTLLALHDRLNDPALLELAVKAARRAATLGVAEQSGLKWAMNPTFARRMPNFSHGTAGVSYFLATVGERVKDNHLIDVAAQGAKYLRNIGTRTPNNGWKVFHSEPGNEQLFYLSWCHGPAGTARLFYRLGKSDPAYAADVQYLAQGTIDSGVPEQSPGYWNNISQCCGNCGVVEFFTALSRTNTRDAKYLPFAQRVMDNALGRATVDGNGLKWVQAENRVSPDVVIAQTGLMQGAAGVGLALLHLDGAMKGRPDRIVLPDNPWPTAG